MKNKIWLSPPHLTGTELQYLEQALEQNWITTTGPQVQQFEECLCRLSGASNVLATSSGTAAIHLALLTVGVKPGDYVLCPGFTFAATAFPVLYCGAIPVFIDSEKDTWNMDPSLLLAAIRQLTEQNKKPAAIIAVDIYGNPADYTTIRALADHYRIPLVEDAAQAFGSTYEDKMCGTAGDLGIYSFNGNKIITTGGGGALLTDSPELHKQASLLANQSNTGTHYYLHPQAGYNYRMSNVLAALGIAQTNVLTERVKQKKRIFEKYSRLIQKDTVTQQELPKASSNRWLSCFLFEDQSERDRIFYTLSSSGIDSRFLMNPLHRQPVFSGYPSYLNGISDDLFSRGLCLPSGTALTDEAINYICSLINSV